MAIISIIEDSPAMAKLIEIKLKAHGHDVTHYPDGQLGLEGIIQAPPEILVLDVDLPYLNGFEVAQKIREHKVIEQLPILMLTGRSDVQSRVRGLEYVDDYLSKPFSPDEFIARIKSLLRRSTFNAETLNAAEDAQNSGPAMVPRSLKALNGATIGQYSDLQEIGKGGMSVVYKALDTVLNRHVSLKFFTDLSDNQDLKERFMREAEAAAILNHGNICSVHTVDETEECYPFMVMPFLEGENLEERLAKGPLKFETSINYIRQIARGLASAHNQGIVHRDVKPANIFITDQGTVKLLDFGIAQWHRNAHRQRLTQPGSMVGTVSYMAPEQILSQPVDTRADIWSLGAVIFEMLSGVKPFINDGNILTTINSIVHKPLPQIEDYLPIVRPEIKRVFAKTLCKDPNGRYSSTLELLRELDVVQKNILNQQNMAASHQETAGNQEVTTNREITTNTENYLATQDLSEAIARFQEMTMIE